MMGYCRVILALTLLLGLPATGGAETVVHLRSTTTVTPSGWEEEASLALAHGALSLASLVTWVQGLGFAGAVLSVEYTAGLLISNQVTVSTEGFQGWRWQAQVPLGELLTFAGEANFDPKGFAGGLIDITFNPAGVGADVGVGGALLFAPTGLAGQAIRLRVALEALQVETSASFGVLGFETLDLHAGIERDGFGLGGRTRFVPEGLATVEANARASVGKVKLAGQGLFSPGENHEIDLDLEIPISEEATLSGTAWITSAGLGQWSGRFRLATPAFVSTATATFTPQGFLEGRLGAGLIGKAWQLSVSTVWDRSGFKSMEAELRLYLTL
ncbi:hypothetical protein H5T53_04735 [Candidatus Bipolaricaulota bacterium]|nr:hypothetical protein [Candidatus Bipolaricaulota bacterium]